jgi:hypothetical protein
MKYAVKTILAMLVFLALSPYLILVTIFSIYDWNCKHYYAWADCFINSIDNLFDK